MKKKKVLIYLVLLVFVAVVLTVSIGKTNHPNLLGSKKCASLLSWSEIQSICTSAPQENYSLQKNLIYANKFDDPNYSAGSDTLWNLNPEMIENCENNFEGANVSEIFLNVIGQSISSLADNGVSYSKDDIVGGDYSKIGVAQSAIFSKGNLSISLREVAEPMSVSLICTKDQAIELIELVKEKIY